ncbi:MAG: GTP-binding protein [Bacilli bacterium]|nr:GTP-binding protein [Bacilli bacterium]
MKYTKSVPITLITGYLGSGKTTLINHILKNAKGHHMAVIVNDIGEVNIDADLIQSGGVVSSGDDSLVPLSNGCICCTLKADLVNQINDLVSSDKYDHILIEASGICEPVPIAQTISYMENEYTKRGYRKPYYLDAILSVTDALRLRDEFGCGEALEHAERGEEDLENLVIQQIEFCDIVLLNKASLLSKEELERVEMTVKALQPVAKIVRTDYCAIDIDELLDTHLFDFDKAATSAAWIREFEDWSTDVEKPHHDDDDDDHDEHEHHRHDEDEHEHHHDDDDHDEHDHDHEEHEGHHHHHHHHHHHAGIENEEEGTALEYNITTFVYYRRRGFDFEAFEKWADGSDHHHIIRAKGLVYFVDNPDQSYIYESAGKQRVLTGQGQWYSSALSEEQIQKLLETDVNFAHDWDEEYQDKMVKLVFIGQNLDENAIRKELDQI